MALVSGKSVALIALLACGGGIACESKIGTKSQSGVKVPLPVAPKPITPPATPVGPMTQPPAFEPPPDESVVDTPVTPVAPPASITPGNGSGPPPIDQTTTASAGLVEAQRTDYQTGDPVAVRINGAFFAGASTFVVESILPNGTPITFIEGDVALLQGAMGEGYKITPQPDGSVLFEFFPGPGGNWDGRFTYGTNTVRVTADDPVEPRFADFPVSFKDFDVFGITLTSFGNGLPVAEIGGPDGFRFQGWIDLVSPAVAKADGVVLTNGFFNIINSR